MLVYPFEIIVLPGLQQQATLFDEVIVPASNVNIVRDFAPCTGKQCCWMLSLQMLHKT